MAKKYLIVDNNLYMSYSVEFHRELLPNTYNTINGGGRFEYNLEQKIIIFYGVSNDFGHCSASVLLLSLKDALISPTFNEFEVRFSSREYYSDAINNYVVLDVVLNN